MLPIYVISVFLPVLPYRDQHGVGAGLWLMIPWKRRSPQEPCFTPVSQLLSLQRSPCVSLLGWDTEQFQRWGTEGLGQMRGTNPVTDTILPRARLLLVGYMSDYLNRGNIVHDGNLYVRDASGCVTCEVTQFDLSLLGSLVLLPCWSYIPTQHGGGYVEVLSPPIPITPTVVRQEVPGPAGVTSITPERAVLLLDNRSHPRGFRVSVTGQLSSVSSLVEIRHKMFFSFLLQDAKKSIPVIVQVPSKLSWYHTLHVGDTYEVTSLSVSSLRGSSLNVFAVTSSSHLLCRPPLSSPPSTPIAEISEDLSAHSQGDVFHSQGDMSHILPQERPREGQHKESKTLTYQGLLTRVLDARAGLYELDGAVVLCTAYTQLRNRGRGLREGAKVEVCDAHLQQSPSPLFPTLMLSCCLRSRVRICQFSCLSAPCPTFSGSGNIHLHLLFRYQLRLPEYLWVCNLMEKLQEKLCPRLVRQRCLTHPLGSGPQGLAQKLLSPTLSSLPDERCERDLQEEMLVDSHDCPLREYSPLSPPWCLPHLSLIPSLVSNSQYLQREESNRSLHWSYNSLRSEDLSTPHVLLGVLHVSSLGSLQLKDQLSTLTCLILPGPPIAWLGCVLEVCRYQPVTESVQDREKREERRSRTYAVFTTRDVRVLHSSDSCPSCPAPESSLPPPSKVPRLEVPWAQRHLLIESLEGRLFVSGHDDGFQFKARASWVDIQQLSPEEGGREPGGAAGNEGDKQVSKVTLQFSSSSVRWFHFLQPSRLYRITATGERDSGIFDLCSPELTHAPQCLRVHSAWTLEDVEATRLSPYPAEGLCIEDALKDSSRGSLLSVTGVVSSRTMCCTQSTCLLSSRTHVPDSFLPHGVSLKVILTQPGSQTSASVYLDLFKGPYPLGLLPGATVSMQGLERKVSRSGRPYLRSVPTTYVRVLSPPTESSESVSVPPLVLLKNLPGPLTPQRAVCSVTCVFSLTLYWDCSMCGSAFMQAACDRSPFCTSQSGVFRATACVKAEDGSGEVQLYLQDEAVSLMLGVNRQLWEALQGQVLTRGKVVVKSRGRSEMPGEEKGEDPLVDYLTFLISRPGVSRPLILTFRQHGRDTDSNSSASPQLTHFRRGEREYVTRVPLSPVVTCVQLQEVEPRALCHMIRERSQSNLS
ncbi:CST complex subunit CTC1 isoform X2 [Mixophyes fleayi]|uniref:CST complex subunit CTC1 isoform X2 n=1 Tax=Mixophyes fleayi TaxID=3061075 RepID=UPI003F4E3A20